MAGICSKILSLLRFPSGSLPKSQHGLSMPWTLQAPLTLLGHVTEAFSCSRLHSKLTASWVTWQWTGVGRLMRNVTSHTQTGVTTRCYDTFVFVCRRARCYKFIIILEELFLHALYHGAPGHFIEMKVRIFGYISFPDSDTKIFCQ